MDLTLTAIRIRLRSCMSMGLTDAREESSRRVIHEKVSEGV